MILLIIKTTVAPADLFKVKNEYYPYFTVKYTLNLIMVHSYASFLKPEVSLNLRINSKNRLTK